MSELVSNSEQLWRYNKEYDNLALKDVDEITLEEVDRMMELEDLIWEIEDSARNKV